MCWEGGGEGRLFPPNCLVMLVVSGRSPNIPERAVLGRLTHCHSFYRHCAHTVGMGIIFQVYFFTSSVFCINTVTSRGYGTSPHKGGLGWREAIHSHLPPLNNSQQTAWPGANSLRRHTDTVVVQPTPLDQCFSYAKT